MTIDELETLSPGHWYYDVGDQLKQHVYQRSERAFAAGDAARDALSTREALEARQHALRGFLIESLGGLPSSETPLQAQTVGEVPGAGFRIEKVIFQSRPRNYVTANLYLPDGRREPGGAVLFLCGHHRDAKHAEEYQSVCQHLVQAGLVVLAQDPIGQGERLGYYEPALGDSTVSWGTTEHDHVGAQCLPLGDALARYFLHDAMRGIDYLRSRPEVDAQRIGVTGNSGGGTQTCLMMLADPRIAAAAPATFVMNRRSYLHAGGAQDAEQIWPGFSAQGFDHEDVLLAMVPRPVRVLAVTGDFFPIEGTRETMRRSRRFWELYGQAENLDLVEDDSTHAFTPALARAAAAFFSRHLLGRDSAAASPSITPFEPRRLWCTASGQVRGELPEAASVFEANQERLPQREQERRSIPAPQRRERALGWLRDRVFHDRQPCALNPRFYHRGRLGELVVQSCFWWSQEGLFSHASVFRHFGFAGKSLPVSLAVWDRGTGCLRAHQEWIETTCAGGRAVLVLDVSGSGALSPRPISGSGTDGFYGTIHKLATDLIWLGDDLVSLRTYDVLRALEMIERWPGTDASDIAVYAHGNAGLYGRLAAALDTRIRTVELAGGLCSYAEWVRARCYDAQGIYSIILPAALRFFDLPEICAEP